MPGELPNPDPPLSDGRVALRPWTAGDAELLGVAADDPLVRRYRASVADLLADPAAWIRAAEAGRASGTRLELALCAAGEGRPLGSVSLWGIHPRNRDAMVSWWLGAQGRGRGLGTNAVGLLCGWTFDALPIERIGASIEEGNAASRALAARCGFLHEGRLRSYQRLPDGTRVDCLSYSLLPGELRRGG